MNGNFDRMLTINRRRLLATATSFAIGASLARTGLARRPSWADDGHPFSPARTVVLPHRLGRRHQPARRTIERNVEEVAGKGLWRLPAPKTDTLLQVADAVTEYYGIGDRVEAWADRIPVQESFAAQSGEHAGMLNYWQPTEPVPGAGWPVDWWLFFSLEPIEWGSLDDLPIFALIAHVSPINFHHQMGETYDAWSDAWKLLRLVAETDSWPRLARRGPLDVIRRLNGLYDRGRRADA
jgi:hypothetical protein